MEMMKGVKLICPNNTPTATDSVLYLLLKFNCSIHAPLKAVQAQKGRQLISLCADQYITISFQPLAFEQAGRHADL